MKPEYIEWVGYVASAMLMISFMMKNINKLRIFNSVGCLLFVIYGFLIGSYPVIITNTFIVGVNLYYLFKKPE